jgi:cation:H+ antiporter
MEHLIKEAWFEAMSQPMLIGIAIVATYALIKGADWLVEGASGIAHRIGVPKIIVGATIVSLGTTSPEAAVSVMAAWQGNAGLALGNAVGSIIADSGLIFGLGCLLVTLPADRFVLQRQGWVQFGSGVLLAALCYGAVWLFEPDLKLSRVVGVALLALLALYLWISVKWSKQHRHGEPFQMPEDAEPHDLESKSMLAQSAMAIAGLALVLVFSDVLIKCVVRLAVLWGVPQEVIASTLVALGTSMPELVIGMTALRKGHYEILVGNVIGADILNVLFVIGASAAAKPLVVPELFLKLHLPVMLIILIWFRIAIFSAVRKGAFTRWHGAPLLVIYVAYLVLNYVMGRGA